MPVLIKMIILLFLLNSCSGAGRTVDPTVWDDIFDVSQELGKGKSVSEALGSVKWAKFTLKKIGWDMVFYGCLFLPVPLI